MSDDMRKALELARKRIEYLGSFGNERHQKANEAEFFPIIDAALAQSRPVSGEAPKQWACMTCCGDGHIQTHADGRGIDCPDCEGTGRQATPGDRDIDAPPAAAGRGACDRTEFIIDRAINCGWITVSDRAQLKATLRIALDTEVRAGGPYLDNGWNAGSTVSPQVLCVDCGDTGWINKAEGINCPTCWRPDPDYVLPCDVRLPPATTISKGCKLSALLTGLKVRETYPAEGQHFPALPRAEREVGS